MKQKQHLLDLLKKVSYFSGLDKYTLILLQEKMQLIEWKSGEVICTEGEEGDWMFIMESGEVSVLKRGKDGESVEIAQLQAGDIGGEMSLFGQGTRSATLRVKSKTKAWILDHPTFQLLIADHPSLAKALLYNLSRHLSRESSVVAKLLSRDTDRHLKVAFFDSKPYTEKIFHECNRFNYKLQFFESRLSLETVSLAVGFKVVCVFVNDNLDEAVIKELHAIGIELIALRCAGFNNVDMKACEHYGVSVVRVPAYSPYAVAEHAVALMMTLNRRMHQAHNRVREGNFSLTGLVGFDIHGKTAGIIGAGKIGRCMLSIMDGFGCRLLAYEKYPDEQLNKQLGVQFVEFDELLTQSDIISLHIPLIPETHHMIDAAAIDKMKDGVMLINTSRGALIDTGALLNGLKSGKIGYAGLDVYEDERDYFFEDFSDRIVADDLLARLTTFNNVLITSHQAFLTQEALCNIADTTLENIREYENGKRMTELPNYISSVSIGE